MQEENKHFQRNGHFGVTYTAEVLVKLFLYPCPSIFLFIPVFHSLGFYIVHIGIGFFLCSFTYGVMVLQNICILKDLSTSLKSMVLLDILYCCCQKNDKRFTHATMPSIQWLVTLSRSGNIFHLQGTVFPVSLSKVKVTSLQC